MKNKKNILVFGLTGSIGESTISVIKNGSFNLVGFSYYHNLKKAQSIQKQFPKAFIFSPIITNLNNVKSYEDLINKSKPDLIVNAVVGFAGLELSLLTIKHNINLALANKESLVIGGWLINKLLKKSKTKIYPIDSEHSALYDLIKNNKKQIKQIILTASGGPFFNKKNKELKDVKFENAIKHPNWKMGERISLDSATLINKCFEIIEAYYLFNTTNIYVVQHKQSIVHALLLFTDNSYFACLSNPDMKLAIKLALNQYENHNNIIKSLDFNNLTLNFNEIDSIKWKPIKWAYDFLKTKNKATPIIINAANEILFNYFKTNKIRYDQITEFIQKAINKYSKTNVKNLTDIKNLNNLVIQFINHIIK